jgi:hypothetical protein
MVTIAEMLEKLILESPFLEEGIAEGIINLSALARKMKPRIEKALMKEVSESALIMALKRMSPGIVAKVDLSKKGIAQLGDLTVRSELSEFTFIKTDTLLEKQKQLLEKIKDFNNPFVTFTQGVYEITAIINSRLCPVVEGIFKDERIVARLDRLAAITIRLTPESVNTPGVHYSILKQLAWMNINVVEVVSTYTEFTIILKKEQVDMSFSILMTFLDRE